MDADVWLGGDVSVTAAVNVTRTTNGSASALGDTPVRFFARSLAGVFTSQVSFTDATGHASATLLFRLPLASQELNIIACLAQETSVCTDVVFLNLKRRFELSAAFQVRLSGAFSEVPSAQNDIVALSDNTFSTLSRVTFLTYLTDSVGLYASVPIESHRRSVDVAVFRFLPRQVTLEDSIFGYGGVATGLRYLHDNLTANVEFTSAASQGALTSQRGTGPGIVSIGTGLNTISASFQYVGFRPRTARSEEELQLPKALILGGGISKALPRSIDGGTQASQGIVGGVSGGLAFPTTGGSTMTTITGGYVYFGSAFSPNRGRHGVYHDVQVIWKVQGLRWRGVFRPSVTVGGFGLLERPAVFGSLGIELRPFRWGRRG